MGLLLGGPFFPPNRDNELPVLDVAHAANPFDLKSEGQTSVGSA